MQVVVAPGANCETGHETGPTFGSETPTWFNATLPVFVSTNEYVIVDPAELPEGAPAVLSIVMAGARVIVVLTVSVAVGLLRLMPDGGVPVTVAVLLTVPASTSSWVNV